MSLKGERIQRDFPVFSHHEEQGKRLVYLDSAASTLKPKQVIDTLSHYYQTSHANIHRGVYDLSMKATHMHDESRYKVQGFLGAANAEEIIFTRGTTESVNLVAQSLGDLILTPGTNVVISLMDHHANFVPWQVACKRYDCELRVIGIDTHGNLDMNQAEKLIDSQTAMVSIVHVSNTLGTVNPVEQLVSLAHTNGAYIMLDGAQAVGHFPVDVQQLGCDFYTFSGHKLFAPTGIGVLYGKKELLSKMPPYQFGGDMIKMVSVEETLFNELPYKFEAGTPDIGGAIALGAAIDYVESLGWEAIQAHDQELLQYATSRLEALSPLHIIGKSKKKVGIISFSLEGIHPHDVGTLLNEEGIAVRTGHHCTMPLMQFLGTPGTTRASLSIYNTKFDIDHLVEGLKRVFQTFS